MSIKAMVEVWEHSQHRSSRLVVLLALADWANDDGWCWYSIESIARKARLGTRQVVNALRAVQESGELEVYYNLGPYYTNLYRVAAGGMKEFAPPPPQLGVEVVVPPDVGGDAILRLKTSPNTKDTIIPPSLIREDDNNREGAEICTPTIQAVKTWALTVFPGIKRTVLDGLLAEHGAEQVGLRVMMAEEQLGRGKPIAAGWLVRAVREGWEPPSNLVPPWDRCPECGGRVSTHKHQRGCHFSFYDGPEKVKAALLGWYPEWVKQQEENDGS